MTVDYGEFVSEVESRLSSRLAEDTHFSIRQVIKNNGAKWDGLVMKKDGDDMSPTLYLNAFYDEYTKGVPIDKICTEIMDLCESSRQVSRVDVAELLDYEAVKDRIIYRLVNATMNEELLDEVPYIPYLDFAITFHIKVKIEEDITGTILIHNEHMKIWNVGVKELMERATANTQRICPAEVMSMHDLLTSSLGDVADDLLKACPMYVLTNTEHTHGAAVVLYPGFLADISERFDDDLYILPSSIHEMIVMPSCSVDDPAMLLPIIGQVNETEIAHEDLLSSHAYIYRADEKRMLEAA